MSLDHLTSWNADWSELRVVVLGLAPAAFSAADTLTELGATVLVATEDAAGEYATLVPVIGAELVETSLDEVPAAVVAFAPDVVIATTEFDPTHPVITWAQRENIAVWGDVELAWRVRDKVTRADGSAAEWLLVTGTSGAAEATRLAATMIRQHGLRVAPCGGDVPVLDAVRDPAGFDVFVVELTSRQLWFLGLAEQAGQPVPFASVCLNHEESAPTWHGSADAYREAHAVVYRNTAHACVYNKADLATRDMVEDAEVIEGARAIGFDLGVPGPSDLGVVDGLVVDRAFLAERRNSALEIIEIDALAEVGLASPTSVSIVLAATALSRSVGATPEAINTALRTTES